MRKFLVCSLTLCMAFLSAARADDKVDVKDLIKKAVKAHGGLKNLKKYKAEEQTMEGTVQIMGQDVKFTGVRYFQAPGQLKSEMSMSVAQNDFTVVNVFNKGKGWVSINNMTQEMTADMIKAAKKEMEAVVVSNLYPLLDKKYKLSPIGEEKVNGKPAFGITVSSKGMKDVQIYLDKKTHHLVKMSFTAYDPQAGEEVNQDLLFSDYKKDQSGVYYPASVTMKRDGKDFVKAKVTKMTFHEKLDNSVFSKP